MPEPTPDYIPGDTWGWDRCPAFVQRLMLELGTWRGVYCYQDYMLWRIDKPGQYGIATFVGWIHPGLNRPEYKE